MALDVMAGLWPLRPRSLCAGFWPCERVSETEREQGRLETGAEADLDVMAGLWPLRPRSLCAGFWPCERVSENKPDQPTAAL